MRPPVCSVSFRSHHINIMIIKSSKKRLIIPEKNGFGVYSMLFHVCLQHRRHGAVKNADLLSVQCRRLDGYVFIDVMLDEIVCLIAHRGVRISYDFLTVLSPGETRKKIYIAVQQLLVQVPEFTVHIIIMPSGILREFLIILVSVPGFHGSLLSAFLENLVFIIAYTDSIAPGIRNRSSYRNHCSG